MAAEHVRCNKDMMNDPLSQMQKLIEQDQEEVWTKAFNMMTDLGPIFEGASADVLMRDCVGPMKNIGDEYTRAYELIKKIRDKAQEFSDIELDTDREFMAI